MVWISSGKCHWGLLDKISLTKKKKSMIVPLYLNVLSVYAATPANMLVSCFPVLS